MEQLLYLTSVGKTKSKRDGKLGIQSHRKVRWQSDICFKWVTAVNGFRMTAVGFNDTQAPRQQTDLGPESGSGETEETDYY